MDEAGTKLLYELLASYGAQVVSIENKPKLMYKNTTSFSFSGQPTTSELVDIPPVHEMQAASRRHEPNTGAINPLLNNPLIHQICYLYECQRIDKLPGNSPWTINVTMLLAKYWDLKAKSTEERLKLQEDKIAHLEQQISLLLNQLRPPANMFNLKP